MKLFAVLLLMAVPAAAQPARPGDGTAPAAVNTVPGPSRTEAAPVAGANSFSENQARRRIGVAGFANVLNLKKDDKGIWRGTATQDGRQVAVSLDYQGNVAAN